jgi:hypothetical protein
VASVAGGGDDGEEAAAMARRGSKSGSRRRGRGLVGRSGDYYWTDRMGCAKVLGLEFNANSRI